MFGPEYYRVGGYITEAGGVYCINCYSSPNEETENRDARSEAELDDLAETGGLSCDRCHEWVVEPWCDLCNSPGHHEDNCPNCPTCGGTQCPGDCAVEE